MSTGFEAPIRTPLQRVVPEWVDYNGHLNMAYYNVVFDRSLDAVFDLLDIGAAYVTREQASGFTAEVHVTYLREVLEGDQLEVTFQLLDWDEKRMHFFQQMYHAEERYLAATSEQMNVHVNLATRRAAPYPGRVQKMLADMTTAHAMLPKSPQVGHTIGIRRRAAG